MSKMQIPADAPTWARTLIERYNNLYTQTQSEIVSQKLEIKLKDVPKIFWHRRTMPSSEDEIEAFVEEVKTDFAEFVPPLENSNSASQKELEDVAQHMLLMGNTAKKPPEDASKPKTEQDKIMKNVAENIMKGF
jgi:hypothetical protein